MAINMAREKFLDAFDFIAENAGQMIERGLVQWPNDSTEKGNAFSDLIQKTSQIKAPDIYIKAYERWYKTVSETANIAVCFGQLDGRLFIGTGEPSPLETAVTLHSSYGVPIIPGSAVKGMLRHYADYVSRNSEHGKALMDDTYYTLFGRSADPDNPKDVGEAGTLIFHDAWWVPNSSNTPLHPETVTVHHRDYYTKNGDIDASDFDTPMPNPQIAVRGGFFFVIEGDKKWANFAISLLSQALQTNGIGAKTASGYGYMTNDTKLQERWNRHTRKSIERINKKNVQLKTSSSSTESLNSAIEQEMHNLIDTSKKDPHRALIDALETESWDKDKRLEVAKYTEKLMKHNKIWREKPATKNPNKRNYRDTQKIIKYLSSFSGD